MEVSFLNPEENEAAHPKIPKGAYEIINRTNLAGKVNDVIHLRNKVGPRLTSKCYTQFANVAFEVAACIHLLIILQCYDVANNCLGHAVIVPPVPVTRSPTRTLQLKVTLGQLLKLLQLS